MKFHIRSGFLAFLQKMWRCLSTGPTCCMVPIVWLGDYYSPSAIIPICSLIHVACLAPMGFSNTISQSAQLWGSLNLWCSDSQHSLGIDISSKVHPHICPSEYLLLYVVSGSADFLIYLLFCTPLFPDAQAASSWQCNSKAFSSYLDILYFSPELNGLASGFRPAWLGKKDMTDLASLASSQNKCFCSLFTPPFHKCQGSKWIVTKWWPLYIEGRRPGFTLAVEPAIGSRSCEEQKAENMS